MKTVISLIVPIVLLVTLSRDNQVNGECFELIQQYYECKNLVMVLDKKNKTYIPSTLVPNNILNDAFYESLNLNEKTFDEAMDLFWQIYEETNNCDTEFCKCVSTGIIDWYKNGRENKFSMYFRNATNYEQMKIIVSEFLEKFESTLKPYSDLEMFFKEKAHSNQVLPTLAQFCMKYDYTDERYIYHYDSLDCFTDDITVHDCKFDITVDKVNKTVIRRLTNPMMEKLMTCNLANTQNCPAETQKFHLLTSWAQEYPTFAWQGDFLTDYYDKLISDSHNINPEMKFVKSYLITKNDTLFVSNLNLESSYKIKPTNQFVANLLISPNINIECTWTKRSLDDADNNYRMTFFNFTFRTEGGYSIYSTNLSSLIDKRELNINPLTTNNLFRGINEPAPISIYGSYEGENNYYIYENIVFSPFDTYLHVFFNTTHFKLYLPDYQWAESSSVFVTGFDGFEPITTPKPTTTQSTKQTTESTEIPTTNKPTTAIPFNSASRISSLSFNLIITFILLNLCKF